MLLTAYYAYWLVFLILKFRASLIIFISLLLSACVFYPEIKQEQPNQKCTLFTPKWQLSNQQIQDFQVCDARYMDDEEFAACLVALGVVLPVTSAIVSGSFVLFGNTLNWLEYQGKCDESFLRQSVRNFKLNN